MQDSDIVFQFKAQGADEVRAQAEKLGVTLNRLTKNTNGMYTGTGKLTEATNRMTDAQRRAIAATDKASNSQASYFGHIARTTVQSAIINKVFLELVDVLGQAVEQVDLMNNFPATMASMGQSTKESSEAFKTLNNYVGQTGANLGQAVSMVTRFTGVTNDVKAATAIYAGLNNALVAGDTTLEEQKNAAIQFSQALERGKPDMKEWNTLTTVMSQQLGIVAKSMGYVNANALGQALRDGKESMGTFTAELTKLSTGTGPIAEQAMARMNGIQFAFNVMKNALTQGVAQVVNAFGRSNIVNFFKFVTQVIQVLTSWVITLINWLGNLANMISRFFGGGDVFKGIAGDIEAGAVAASNMGDGLGEAKDEAKELKKQLAGFDKMNVLTEKSSGKDKDTGAKGTAFDMGEISALNGAFDGISGELQDASMWAKIFAGILVGITALSFGSKLIGAIRLIGGNFKWLGDGVGKVVGFIGKSFKSLPGIISKALPAIGPWLAGAVRAIGVFLGTVGKAAAAIPGIGWLIAAITTIISLAIWAATDWEGFSTFWTELWTNVSSFFVTIWQGITDFFAGVWQWLVDLWSGIVAVFAGPFEVAWQIISGIFILLVAVVATVVEAIFKLLMVIADWVYKNVIEPVARFFVNLWNGVINTVAAWWTALMNLLAPVFGWINVNVIQPIGKFFGDMWNGVVNFIKGFVTNVKNFLNPIVNWINQYIIQPIAGFFSGLWNGITSGVKGMVEGIKTVLGMIGNFVKTPINAIIDALNGVIDSINRVKVPDWVPGLGGKSPNFPKIPKLARGGVLHRSTLVEAGEAGTEAIVPLENNTEWVDKVAALLNNAGGGNQPVNLTVQIGEEKILTTVIDLINDKTKMSGRNAITV